MPKLERQRLDVRETGSRIDIKFSRPEARNALDFETWDDLDAVMREVQGRDDLHVVTLTGAGQAFSAGVDFKAISEALEVEREHFPSFIRRWSETVDRFERCAQPTIAAINGPAVGAGFEIALACDIRIASELAVFAMPQMMMGILPDVGGTSRLSRAVGGAIAKDLILSSRVVDAQEALRWGIVSRVVPASLLTAEVDELADHIAGLPWPAAYLAMAVTETGARLDSRRAEDLEAIANQMLLRNQSVWDLVERFMQSKGLKARTREP